MNGRRSSLIEVDPYFLRTLGLELVEGEDFPPDLLASGRVALVNQAASGHARGTGRRLLPRRRVPTADYWRGLRLPARRSQLQRLRAGTRAQRSYRSVPLRTVLVRVRPEEVTKTLAELREAWERLSPGVPFSYRFLEDHIAERFLYPKLSSLACCAG